MEYIKNLQIAYIGGGSKGWAWKLMGDLALEEQLSGTVKLYDVNYEAAHDNQIIGNNLNKQNGVKSKWKYEAVETLKDALVGAHFIIISILPGTFKDMEADINLPQKYGIYQSVGDTVGPGGLIRGLRSIPMFIDIAKGISSYSPKAWVINYTNPMSLCVRVLYATFPNIKAFGCCHEVFDVQSLLVAMLRDLCDIDETKREDIKTNVLGINHFTWIDQATYQNMDLMPLYSKLVNKYFKEGFERIERGNWKDSYFNSAEMVKFDLFKRYGLIAAVGDRHLVEFFPGQWYLRDAKMVESWKFHLTPVDWRIKQGEELARKSMKLISGEETFNLKPSGEEGVKQIKALLGLRDLVTNTNLPNQGQLKGIPDNSIVETNAVLRKDYIRPVLSGSLPHELNNLTIRSVYNQETIIKAVLNKDKKLAFTAFINDPLVGISLGKAKNLFEEMLEATKKYLPEWEKY